MAKDSVKQIEQDNIKRNDLDAFIQEIKSELKNVEVQKMVKKNPKESDLSEYIGFIDTEEETDCMRDHDVVF